VFLLGGSGYFGRLLLDELLRETTARIVVAGRDLERAQRTCDELGRERLTPLALDLASASAVNAALDGVALAICAAGPFQTLPTTLAKSCIARGVAYIDLADDRRFVGRVRELAASARGELPTIATGWSAAPALSAVLVSIASGGFETLDTIRVQLAPGNRNPRRRATVFSLLASVGRPIAIQRDGVWRTASGWSEPRSFGFPSPIGRRTGYLVDAPDLELFPELFGARTVEFRAGAELGVLNAAVSALARLARGGAVRDWTRHEPLLRAGMALFSRLGTSAGALGVEVGGTRAGKQCRARACVAGSERGERIAVLPAAVIARRVLDARASGGVLAWHRWLDREGLEREAARRGFRLVVEAEARA